MPIDAIAIPKSRPSLLAYEVATQVLADYVASHHAPRPELMFDAGPIVLATLVAESGEDVGVGINALGTWLEGVDDSHAQDGVFGSMSGYIVGTQLATSIFPGISPLAQRLRGALVHAAESAEWRTRDVNWEDYDLVSGPAGFILALGIDETAPATDFHPFVQQLVSLTGGESLERLRVIAYEDDERRSWNYGRINTGLAHGITGVAAALRLVLERFPETTSTVTPALRRICVWLVQESWVDSMGLRTWDSAGLDGRYQPSVAGRRQGWCYGTPGLAWTLWEASRVLDDVATRAFAEEAMVSFCAVFDESRFLDPGPIDSTLGFCHGAAGTLAIADAFARHAHLQEAAQLAERLDGYLASRMDDVRSLAGEDMSILSGACGILAVLLSRSGGSRSWLTRLALR